MPEVMETTQETKTLEEVIRHHLRPISVLHLDLMERPGFEEVPTEMGHTLAALAMRGATAIEQWEELSGPQDRESNALEARQLFQVLALVAYTFTPEGLSVHDGIEDLEGTDSFYAFNAVVYSIAERWLDGQVATH